MSPQSDKNSKKKGLLKTGDANFINVMGDNMNFASKEAYKLLRANLLLSLADEKDGKVIGFTSSLAGEGKSTAIINTAYYMAQNEKKVLLIEGDMRRPTMAKRLNLKKKPGLSNLIAKTNDIESCIQKSGIIDRLDVIVSGDMPPNPSELLGSESMKEFVGSMRKEYDIILLDLPPVNGISDALVCSTIVDGFVMIVRQNYCHQSDLAEAMHLMQFSQARILGVVTTCANFKGNHKYGKYKYKNYYYSKADSENKEKSSK